jgi:hypothetical protein
MKSFLPFALVLAAILAAAPPASAQVFYPPQAGYTRPGLGYPTVSPYLGLRSGFGNPAVNYYGLVRPQMNFRNDLLGLQGGLQDQAAFLSLQQQQYYGNTPGVVITGTAANYQTHLRYFQNRGANTAGTAGRGGILPGPTTGGQQAASFSPPRTGGAGVPGAGGGVPTTGGVPR